MADLGGRPLAFKSVEELEQKIADYFSYCDNRTKRVWKDKTAEEILVIDPAPFTMAGLAYALGVSRQTIINYSEKEGYFDTIKRARERVEADVEERMNDKDKFTPGLIFNAINNFGWRQRNETDITSMGQKLEAPRVIIDAKE